MPQLLFPKRDVEGIPPSASDNNIETTYTFQPNEVLNVSYATPKTVYAIILLPPPRPATFFSSYFTLYVTTDGTTFSVVEPFRANGSRSDSEVEKRAAYWWINQSIKGWRISIPNISGVEVAEIIVLVADNTKPFLPVIYPDSIEVLNIGTTNLDSFSGLSNISDGDDNTYATFTFRGGYSVYTLYLQGTFSIPMATVISPFALIEIDPLTSNLAGVINSYLEGSHGYFHWGASNNPSYTSGTINLSAGPGRIPNSPRLRWSQKAYEISVGGTSVQGVLTNDILRPDSATTGTLALISPLAPPRIMNNKTLYVPYFFSMFYRPILVAGRPPDYLYYVTNDLTEPFVYTAANGATGEITLNFGLRIATTSPVSQPFAVKLYGMGFLCFPQMDLELPLTLPTNVAWFDHAPQGNVTRDNNELTESTDITTDEKFVAIYPTAVDVSSAGGRAIRFRIRSTSGGDSNFTIKRYYGFHSASDDAILWYSQNVTYNVGATLQSFDVLGEDQYGQTKVIKVEIIPI